MCRNGCTVPVITIPPTLFLIKNYSDQAQTDLLSCIEGLVDKKTGNDWQYIDLRQTYDPEDESNQNSIRTNATLVFVNGSLTVDVITAIQTVACYVGVSEHPSVLYISCN
jgi:hypothetical protein